MFLMFSDSALIIPVPTECLVYENEVSEYSIVFFTCSRTGRAGRKGFAWTFVTFDNEKYLGDIIKALESTENADKEELEALRKMWNQYKSVMEAVHYKFF